MKTESMLFSERAFQLLSSPGGTRYDLVNGDAPTERTQAMYSKIVADAGTHAAGLHALLLFSLRGDRSTVFWWTLRLWVEMGGFVRMSSESIALITFMWMHCHRTLHASTVCALIETFAMHGLLKHCIAVADEFEKRALKRNIPATLPIDVDRLCALFATTTHTDSSSTEGELLKGVLSRLATTPTSGQEETAIVRTETELSEFERGGGLAALQPKRKKTRGKKIPREKVFHFFLQFINFLGTLCTEPSDRGEEMLGTKKYSLFFLSFNFTNETICIDRIAKQINTKHNPHTLQVEAACVRELLRNAPFGGDQMVHKYITVSNL